MVGTILNKNNTVGSVIEVSVEVLVNGVFPSKMAASQTGNL